MILQKNLKKLKINAPHSGSAVRSIEEEVPMAMFC